MATDTDEDMDIKCDISSEREEYFCDQCPSVCGSKKGLAIHIRKIHSINICSECGFQIHGRKNYNDHIRKHQKKVKCVSCNKEFAKGYMAQHIAKCNRPKNKKRHICEFCGHEAQSPKKLEIHRRKHNKVPKLYNCEYCPYQSPKISNLNRHMETCIEKKRTVPPPGPVTNKELTEEFSDMHVDMEDFNKMLKFFINKFGKEWFEQGATTCIKEFCSSLKHLVKTETVDFQDSEGNRFGSLLDWS